MHLPQHLQGAISVLTVLLLVSPSSSQSLSSNRPISAPPSHTPSPLYKKNIIKGDSIVGEFRIFPDEEPADKVYWFVREHGLDEITKESILADACSYLSCSRTRALVFNSPVLSESGALIGNVEIYDDEEPADVAFEFSTLHNLTDGYFDAILADACETVECHRAEPVILRLPVDLGEDEVSELVIIEGQDPILVVYEFCVDHDLDEEGLQALLSEVDDSHWIDIDWEGVQRLFSGEEYMAVTGEEDPGELLYSVPVQDENGNIIGTVGFHSNIEPADAVYEFCEEHGLEKAYRDAIMANACDVVECTRIEAVIYRLPVHVGNLVVKTFELFEGGNPNDAIHQFCRANGIGEDGKAILMDQIASVFDFEVERALLWDQEVLIDGDVSLGNVKIYEGDEPVDVIYDFLIDKELPDEQYIRMKDVLMAHACNIAQCSRKVAILWSETVETEEGEFIGEVQVLEGQEPIDAIHAFTSRFGLDHEYRESVLVACCEEIECTRDRPLMFQHDINNNEGLIGKLEILEGEEVVDAVVKFVMDYNANVDLISLKNYFFEEACGKGLDILCTRNVAVLYDKMILNFDQEQLGRLVIYEGQEPMDILWTLLSQTVEEEESRITLLVDLKPKVCTDKYLVCKWQGPIIFQQSISGPDGESVGVLQVLAGEEPVDSTYKFFAKYGLFKKDWDFKAVFAQVCNLEGLVGKCKRQQAIKYLEENRVVDGINIGHIVVWEHEEVIDVIYRKRLEHGLTTSQQMSLFNEICQKEEVYCKRTRASVLTREVNKLDYDHGFDIGNSTCARKFMGWRYVAGWDDVGLIFNETWLGPLASQVRKRGWTDEGFIKIRPMKRIVDALNKEGVMEATFENPEFIFAYLAGWNVIARLTCWLVGIRIGWGGGLFRWRRLGLLSQLTLFASSVVPLSFFYAWFVEPDPNIDRLMHDFLGKLPEIEIFEGQEVADAVWDWAKVGEKKHHPLLRQPLYWELIDEICDYALVQEDLKERCNRKKAHVVIDMGAITLWGMEHKIMYWKDPNIEMEEEINSGKVDRAAEEICDRLVPAPPNCYVDIGVHMIEQYKLYEANKWDKKNLYKKLGVASDASTEEIWRAAAKALRILGDNFVPFARIDNGTKANDGWSQNTQRGHGIKDKLSELLDKKDREWYDKPCEPVFGGAMCAKKDASGNMMIEMGGGGEE